NLFIYFAIQFTVRSDGYQDLQSKPSTDRSHKEMSPIASRLTFEITVEFNITSVTSSIIDLLTFTFFLIVPPSWRVNVAHHWFMRRIFQAHFWCIVWLVERHREWNEYDQEYEAV
ncbi:hypothetical protein PMAYCL1PPCAC_33175, partial [Pristionchus mayeri]